MEIFSSYAQEGESLGNELKKYLALLSGKVSSLSGMIEIFGQELNGPVRTSSLCFGKHTLRQSGTKSM